MLVLPSDPSGTPDCVNATAAVCPATIENPLLSDIWNSYVREPDPDEVALLTRSVGRNVSSWASSPGESTTGAVMLAEFDAPPSGAVGVAGISREPLLPHAAAAVIATAAIRDLTYCLSKEPPETRSV
jgi:hypothetical protein